MSVIFKASVAAAVVALFATDAAALTWKQPHLINGWVASPFGTRIPAVAIDADGIVHMRGGMANTATSNCNHFPFVMPGPFRPSKVVYIPANQATGSTGRIDIHPDGTVELESDPALGTDLYLCSFTSLEGVTYAK